MDKREMEKLMDKYKQEMLEFQRRNNTSGYPENSPDEREKALNDALENNTPYELDRSDPLADTENYAENVVADEEPEAVAAQTEAMPDNIITEKTDMYEAADLLQRGCALLPPNATDEQKGRCRELNDFLVSNNENGSLKVETFASDRAFGVPSARVMIFLELPSGNVAVFDGITDINGTTDTVRLPAPPKSLSLSPQTGNEPRLPYAVYSVYVEHPDYVRAVFTNVPVFSGIESIQPVRMLAKSVGENEPGPIVVDETSQNTLMGRG